jgi:hypothetical protein
MASKAMDTYLNDHLAGAMLGSDLAEQIRERAEGTPLGETMATIAPQIEEDRQSLIDLMESIGTSKNPVKQATAWLGEKASRPKFSGFTAGEPEYGTFIALETLTLGVAGKLSLWEALKEHKDGDGYQALGAIDLEALADRARAQHDTLERERLAAGKRALAGG